MKIHNHRVEALDRQLLGRCSTLHPLFLGFPVTFPSPPCSYPPKQHCSLISSPENQQHTHTATLLCVVATVRKSNA